jgi:hypothetical protein
MTKLKRKLHPHPVLSWAGSGSSENCLLPSRKEEEEREREVGVGGESRGILSPQLAGGQETTNPRISHPNPVHRRRQVPILPAELHSGRPQSARLGPPTANSAGPFHPGTSEFLKLLCPPPLHN